MAKSKLTIDELVEFFLTELRTMPLDFPVGSWGERAIKYASEQYYSCGRKGSYKGYAYAIYKAMKAHRASTVHTDYAAEWVAGKTESNCRSFDTWVRR
jgi:hypothetical protein